MNAQAMTNLNQSKPDEAKAIKRAVIDAGLRLVKEGLIVGTSGNISIRLDNDHMAITPSGLPYHTINEEDIVVVNINDLSYDNRNKPSEEKMIHADIYVQNPAANAVVHTHQTSASIIASTRRKLPVGKSEWIDILGDKTIPCAAYGLPGTGKLKKSVLKAIKGRNACFFANHGAICVGADIEEAFLVSKTLELASQHYIDECFKELASKASMPMSKQDYYITHNC